MGKDTTCDLAERILHRNGVSFIRTSFAAKLKKHCAERYDLDAGQMEFDSYKKSKPEHLNGLSVRDVLIKEGTFARQIWGDVWTSSTYRGIFESYSKVALISDFRYPNEYSCFENTFRSWAKKNNKEDYPTPKVVRILAHRPGGVFNSDGSDDQLPDLDPTYWDETILNSIEDDGTRSFAWLYHIEDQVKPIIQNYLNKYVLEAAEG